MSATVSVIVPTYNRAALIPFTLKSVLGQSHPPLEVIIVDDGSKDDTEQQCRDLPAPVRYVKQANAGVSAARNTGARMATGQWLAFVDSDDLWHPDKLKIQLAALAANPQATWSFTGCDVIDLDGAVIPARRGFTGVFAVFAEMGVTPEALFQRYFTPGRLELEGASYQTWAGDPWLPLFNGNFVLPSSSLIRRDVFERLGGFNPAWRLAEETEFFHRLSATEPAVLVAEPLVQYRAGQDGSLVSPANIPKLIENAATSIDQAFALRPDPPGEAAALYAAGKRRLMRKLAWARLSQRDGAATRAALSRYREVAGPDAWSVGVWAASWMPAGLLETLNAARGRLR